MEQLGSVPLNVMKELNECQFSSYKKKQNLTRKQWVGQKEKKTEEIRQR